MADRTMKELLQVPTEGYGEAIIIPEILVENFEIKRNLLQDVPNDVTKLMLFPYSLEGAARIWGILFLEKLLNEDPFQIPLMDLKVAKESKAKSSVEEPPELELKELSSHLEYDILEDSNKLPVIIAKDLKDVEREALINVCTRLQIHLREVLVDQRTLDET
nr:reverse transcriptase domain-containing protein [Tanacetum cinerariifolium]